MVHPFVIPVGPRIERLARLYEDSPSELEDEGPSTEELRRRFEALLDDIPPIEADCLELAMAGKAQREIAEIVTPDGEVTLSQFSISVMISRGLERLRYRAWLASLEIDVEAMARTVRRISVHPDGAEAFVRVFWREQAFTNTGDVLWPDYRYGATKAMNRWATLKKRVQRALSQGDPDPMLAKLQAWMEGYQPYLGSRTRTPWSGERRASFKTPSVKR